MVVLGRWTAISWIEGVFPEFFFQQGLGRKADPKVYG
jgi:hypothetical protein